MPAGRARAERARRDSLLVWKTSHVQAEFILGYSTGATIQHDRTEQSLRWGEHRCSGAKQAQLGMVLGPLRSSPGRAKQSRHSTGLEELPGRGRHCPCKTASCTYTAAARAANKAAESLRTAALCSCHHSTGSGCRENNKTTTTTTKKRTITAINKDRVMHVDGSACGGAGDPVVQQKHPDRSSLLQHLLT